MRQDKLAEKTGQSLSRVSIQGNRLIKIGDNLFYFLLMRRRAAYNEQLLVGRMLSLLME